MLRLSKATYPQKLLSFKVNLFIIYLFFQMRRAVMAWRVLRATSYRLQLPIWKKHVSWQVASVSNNNQRDTFDTNYIFL